MIKPSCWLAVVLTAFLSLATAGAAQYGSETEIRLTGGRVLSKKDKITQPGGGITRYKKTFENTEISNRTVLKAMERKGLIPKVAGYSIVMVGRARAGDGFRFFAVRDGAAPVEIPAGIFSLKLGEGVENGVVEVNNRNQLSRVDYYTAHFATIRINKLTATGLLQRAWSMKKSGAKAVELPMTGVEVGAFSSEAPGSASGVIWVSLRFEKSKIVNLSRYGGSGGNGGFGGGGADGGFGGSTSGSLVLSAGDAASLNLAGSALTTVTAGPSNLSSWTFDLADGSTLSLNSQLVAPGILVAFDGTEVPIYTFGTNPANEITLNTANGPVVYTREGGDVWTLVEPAPAGTELVE